MHRKLLTLLVSACALTAVMAGPATASAATLTVQNALDEPAAVADFEAESTTVTTFLGSFQCDEFTLDTAITQNQADPVTMQLRSGGWAGPPTIDGCQTSSGINIDYSNIQLTGPMTFSANGTGTLPLRVTETWNGQITCVRQGNLSLTYTPNSSTYRDVNFAGYLNRVSGGSFCPTSAHFQGWFDAPHGDGFGPISRWAVTP